MASPYLRRVGNELHTLDDDPRVVSILTGRDWLDAKSYRPDPCELLRESQELRRIKRHRQSLVTWFCVFAASFAFWTVVGVWLVAAL